MNLAVCGFGLAASMFCLFGIWVFLFCVALCLSGFVRLVLFCLVFLVLACFVLSSCYCSLYSSVFLFLVIVSCGFLFDCLFILVGLWFTSMPCLYTGFLVLFLLLAVCGLAIVILTYWLVNLVVYALVFCVCCLC